jgi:hypothetical protein
MVDSLFISNSKMELRKLLTFLVAGIVIVLALDFMIGSGMDWLYGRMKGGERARADYAIRKSNADVYVMGSSRALHHYVPSILADSLKETVYNAGRPAQTMLYHLTVLKLILKRHTPKIVVLDINEDEFVFEPRKHDLLNVFLPYYRSEEIVREQVDRINPGYRYLRWSHVLPYNSSVFAILYRSLIGRDDRNLDNGYIPKIGTSSSIIGKYPGCQKPFVADTSMIRAFQEFAGICLKNKIQLIIVISPRFETSDCARKDLALVFSETKKAKVPLLDFSTDESYISNPNFMYDIPHLNREGSIKFTREIGSRIKGLKYK